jgi:hypothetical protein
MEKIIPSSGKQLSEYVSDIENLAEYNHCMGCDRHSMHQGELKFDPVHMTFRTTKMCKWCGMTTLYVYTIDHKGKLQEVPQMSSQLKIIDFSNETTTG